MSNTIMVPAWAAQLVTWAKFGKKHQSCLTDSVGTTSNELLHSQHSLLHSSP